MKATTVADVKRYAEQQGKTLQELAQEWQIVCFLGDWENPDAEVLVPNSMPVPATRAPVNYIII